MKGASGSGLRLVLLPIVPPPREINMTSKCDEKSFEAGLRGSRVRCCSRPAHVFVTS